MAATRLNVCSSLGREELRLTPRQAAPAPLTAALRAAAAVALVPAS